MSITDELRHEVASYPFRDNRDFALFEAIADRIDAEHQKAIRGLNNLADASVLLPVDADGVPIHLGDRVYQVKGGWVYTVKSISFYPNNTTVTFECEHGFGSDSAHNVRHYHEPTVEDVLREMLDAWGELPSDETNEAIIAEYAAKLRLAETEDA